jgi:hypothetical protein
VQLAVEAEQSVRDVMWLDEYHPDVVETLRAYLQWRAEQNKRRNKGR